MQTPQFPDSRSFDPLPGESQEDRERRLYSLDRTVQAAERVSEKFRELASVLQEWDTSAAEASKAFQDLQDMAASSPLDAEQIRKDADILASFHGAPREPWYKRLWDFLASPFRAASEFEDLVKEYQDAGIWGGTIPPGYSIQDARNIPIPYDRRHGTAIGLPEYKMLVKNSDIDQAFRDPIREPWYKRLWSWLRGTK